MNRSKIEWCDHTWNPITGCRHNCPYCYAKKMTARFCGDVRLNMMAKSDYQKEDAADGTGKVYSLDKPMLNETGKILTYPFGFEPTYHRYRKKALDTLKMGNNIFVCAMADLFGAWVPDQWIREIILECVKRPIHNYLFLTKNPQRFTQFRVPTGLDNMWYGTSITGKGDTDKFNYLPAFCNTFVSLEPLQAAIETLNNVMFRQVRWIIIGAETGYQKDKIIPDPGWIEHIVAEADKNDIPVFMKDSLIPVIGERNIRREFPEQLQKSQISPKMMQKLYGVCSKCGTALKKSDMIALQARIRRGEPAKQFGFMCRRCFMDFCIGLGIDIPFEELQEGVNRENED